MGQVNRKHLTKLKTKLTTEQAQAAELVSANNLLPKPPKNQTKEAVKEGKERGEYRLSYEEIAEKTGVAPKTLWHWRKANTDFIAYVNALAQEFFMANLPDVMQKHLEMTLKGQGSMKGIELFYKFGGLLVDKTEVKQDDDDSESLENKITELKKRAKEQKEQKTQKQEKKENTGNG